MSAGPARTAKVVRLVGKKTLDQSKDQVGLMAGETGRRVVRPEIRLASKRVQRKRLLMQAGNATRSRGRSWLAYAS
ncbi:MAG: hypothetical protein CBCREVIR_1147 [Candidatus Burkholderia crenata]|nr:MAG: hypothetical protein CBCREVIR_1147 [Candidatus Burkholderia crenata]